MCLLYKRIFILIFVYSQPKTPTERSDAEKKAIKFFQDVAGMILLIFFSKLLNI